MKKYISIVTIFLFIFLGNSQIVLDYGNTEYLSKDINCLSNKKPDSFYNSKYLFDQNFKSIIDVKKFGSPLIALDKGKTRLFSLSYDGELVVYLLSNGSIERNFTSKEVLKSIASLSISQSSYNNSFFKSISISDNGKYLIVEMFNFSSMDNYGNYLVMDISGDRLVVETLPNFQFKSELNEETIKSSSSKLVQQNTLKEISTLLGREIHMDKKNDGCYFTGTNNLLLEFIELSNPHSYDKAIKYLTSHYIRNDINTIAFSKFSKMIRHQYLLKGVIKYQQSNYAVFGTSYGSDCRVKLFNLKKLGINYDNTIESSITNVNTYYSSLINSNEKIETNINGVKLVYNNGFYFTSSWFNQFDNKLNRGLGERVWDNNFEWYFFADNNTLNSLSNNAIIYKGGKKDELAFFDVKNGKLIYENLRMTYIGGGKNKPINASKISLSILKSTNFDISANLPKNDNSSTVLSKVASTVTGVHNCEMCAGTGNAVSQFKNGAPVSFQRNPTTGGLVKCLNCGGKGKYNTVTGDIERIEKTEYTDWVIDGFQLENKQVILTYTCEMKKSDIEKRGGHITKSQLSERKTQYYNFIFDQQGRFVKNSNAQKNSIKKHLYN